MRKLFIRFITLIFLLFVLFLILLHFFSRTPSAKAPGFTSLHLLPERSFQHAILFSREDIIKGYILQDSLDDWFYSYAAQFLGKSIYSVKYSMVVKNAIGKYVLYAQYENGRFILITRPRFRLKLLRGFIGGERSEYRGIPLKRIGQLYFYFIEDFLVISPDVDLVKSSIDLALGNRRGSVFDEIGSLEEYDFVMLDNYTSPLIKIKPFVLGVNHRKMVIRGNIVSSVIKDAIKRGKLPDSIPYGNTFLAIKLPYLELYDSYVSYYPDDNLDLSAVLWDMGGDGYLWYNSSDEYLFELASRVEKERLLRDIFVYLREHRGVDSIIYDSTLNVYRFMRANDTEYILVYRTGINNDRFVFTNSQELYEKYKKADYIRDDGRLNLDSVAFFRNIFQLSSNEVHLLDFYFEADSIIPSVWQLEIKEFKGELLIKGKKAK